MSTEDGEKIASDLRGFGGVLRCEKCYYARSLGDVAYYLHAGWPRCCGYTMRWWSQRQIDAGEMPSVPVGAGDPE